MHRKDLLTKLNHYTPFDSNERWMYESLVQFVNTNPDCFHNSLEIGHITGSTWIIDMSRKKVLLTHHRKLTKWIQLGGHADGESNILMVTLREAKEESGLNSINVVSSEIFDVDIHTIPKSQKHSEHLHFDIRFLFEADSDEPLLVSNESFDLSWVELNKVYELNPDESISRMVRKTKRLSLVVEVNLIKCT